MSPHILSVAPFRWADRDLRSMKPLFDLKFCRVRSKVGQAGAKVDRSRAKLGKPGAKLGVLHAKLGKPGTRLGALGTNVRREV